MEKQKSSFSNGAAGKVKLLCSYGGKIWSRPTDRQLSYIGGDTKILAVDRTIAFSNVVAKLNSVCSINNNRSEISIKYQLPGEDLDSLVSLIDDDDVEHMMVEYDRLQRISSKPARLRLFIFETTAVSPPAAKPEPDPNPDYLFGFDKEYEPPLDLLQIPGMALPESCGFATRGGESNGIGGCHVASEGVVVPQQGGGVYHRVPATVVRGGGYYQNENGGDYLGSNGEQPVYNVVAVNVMPSSTGHRPEV